MIKFFFEAIASDAVNPILTDLNLLIIGDSVGSGTSNGTVDVQNGILSEWDGASLNAVTTDIAGANTGTYVPKFAERINEVTGRKVNVIETAVGGAEFSPYLDNNNWSTLGTLYASMITKSNSFVNSTEKSIDYILIILGINDSRGTTALATIESDANSLITRLNADFPNVPKLIYNTGRQAGNYATNQRWLDVRNIITNGVDGLVETYPSVYLAGDLINDYGSSAFYDGLHLNQTANNQLGTDLANYIITTF